MPPLGPLPVELDNVGHRLLRNAGGAEFVELLDFGGGQTILLWRSAEALTITQAALAPVIEPITQRAFCIHEDLMRSSASAS